GSSLSAVISPAGDVAVTCKDSEVNVWGMADCRQRFPPFTSSLPIHNVEFSRDGRYLVTCYADQGYTKCHAQIWDLILGQPVGQKLRHGDGVVAAAFSPDGSQIVTGGEDSKAIVWRAATSERLAVLSHENQVLGVCFDSDGKWIATASSDRTARVWSPETE